MGFLFPFRPGTKKRDKLHGVSAEFMAEQGCKICPLKHAPKALNEGPENAEVFIVGEAPGRTEADEGRPFIGASGRLLRESIPRGFERTVRFGNVVQSYPGPGKDGKMRDPSAIEMAHCRGFLESEIAAMQPRIIIGLGAVPLQAITGQTGILRFAGRRTPIEIAGHRTWYYAATHPAYVLWIDQKTGIKEDVERLFRLHIRRAFEDLDYLPDPVIHTPAIAREGIVVTRDVNTIVGFLERAASLEEVGFDFETDNLRPYGNGRILTVSVATASASLAFPLEHSEARYSASDYGTIMTALVRFVEAPVKKLVHNAAFETEWTLAKLSKAAVRPALWGCSLAQAFLLDPRPRSHSLDFLCKLNYGLNLKELSPLEVTQLADTPWDEVCHYNALDAKYHLKLYTLQRDQILAAGLLPVYIHHMERIIALVRGQAIGLPVDLEVNSELTAEYQKRLARITRVVAKLPEVKLFERKGVKFNIASSRHVMDVLRASGHLDVLSTDEGTLATLPGQFPKAVLAYRSVSKILSTYLTGIPALMREDRLHPIIGTCFTRTWRTSSESPNIQNWPKREAVAREVRRQIVAPPGHMLVSVDYSSIQARCVGMESRDARLVKAFENHYDIHQDWSERIQRHAPKWAAGRDAKTLRHLAKNKFVFASLFGAQPGTVAFYLGVDSNIGHSIQEEFWSAFPDILRWHQEQRRFYRRHMYVTGLSGFRRHAPISQNELINTPIQSDEALLVCEALVRLASYEDDALQPVMMVHDDLGFFVPKQRYDACMHTILTEMLRIRHDWINMPLAVEVAVGTDWFDQKAVGHFESRSGGYVQLD